MANVVAWVWEKCPPASALPTCCEQESWHWGQKGKELPLHLTRCSTKERRPCTCLGSTLDLTLLWGVQVSYEGMIAGELNLPSPLICCLQQSGRAGPIPHLEKQMSSPWCWEYEWPDSEGPRLGELAHSLPQIALGKLAEAGLGSSPG